MKFILTSFLFLYSLSIAAQDYYKMKWGKIPKSDLNMTIYEKDSSANAVILGDNCEIMFYMYSRPEISISRHIRIKILNDKGFDQADISIPFYSKDKYERIESIEAHIFSKDGTQTTLSKEDFFTEQTNQYWSEKKFTFPKLEVGSVIEYRYDLRSRDITNLTPFYFQNSIPTRWSKIRVNIPRAFTYLTLIRSGIPDINETKEDWIKDDVGRRNLVNSGIYAAKDLPAIKAEPFTTTPDDYRMRIYFQFESYVDPGVQQIVEEDSTWSKYANKLRMSKSFGQQYSKKRRFNDLVEAFELVKPKTSNEKELAQAILLFIKKHIPWNGRFGENLQAKDIDEVFELGEGNVAAINLAIVALLQYYEIEAYPAILSTRKHGAPMLRFPQRSQFNYVIVQAKLDGKSVFIDGVHPFCPIGTISTRAMNEYAFLITDDDGKWIKMPKFNNLSIKSFVLNLDKEGNLSGTLVERYTHNATIDRREVAYNEGKKVYIQSFFQEKYPEIEVKNLALPDQSIIFSEPKISHKAEINLPGFAQVSEDYIYLRPLLNEGIKENPFKAEKRQLPINFPHTFKTMNLVEIVIPEGYAVEELPTNKKIMINQNGGSYRYIISQKGNTIKCISTFSIEKRQFEVEEYKFIKEMYNLAFEKQNEQIVLKKIAE